MDAKDWPTPDCRCCGVLYGGGTALAGLAHNLVMLYLAYGVIGGAGLGLAYIVPVATQIRWFRREGA
jgi:OFA family oxalate/formate antiporter-like MFS transporter